MTVRPLFHGRIALVTAPVVAVTLALLVGPVSVSRAASPATPGASPTALSAPAAPLVTTSGIDSVVARDTGVTVTGTGAAGATVTVHALGTEADPAVPGAAPTVTARAEADGRFTATFPRAGVSSDPYYAKFVATVDGTTIGTYRYVDDNETTPAADYPFPQALSKKGLQVALTDDAEEIGNQNAGINVVLNRIMVKAKVDSANTIEFSSAGKAYYFDRSEVESLDRQIKPLSDNGEVVNLILLAQNITTPNNVTNELVHPDADLSAGPIFGFNTKTPDGVAYLTAAFEFVTSRWTAADQAHGRATGFIIGNEVDSQWTWANMGEKSLPDFLLYYDRALRLAEMAAQKAYGQARVYTSLTHCWTIVCGANPQPDRPTRYYPVKTLLDTLNAMTKEHGDYDWLIAQHPYPENLFNPAFWNDQTATGNVDTTQRITFKNIELLPQYLARPELRFDGEPRRIILSEQGCNTPGTGADAEKLQAACYALAYYKVRFTPGIDAFILHRHVDNRQEGGLKLGLWTWDDKRPTEAEPPGRQKLIYAVFRDIDTARSLQATAFALDVIGIKSWSELVPGFDASALAQRMPASTVGAAVGATARKGQTIGSFDRGTQGWRVSDNATSVTRAATDGGALRVGFTAYNKLWRGTDRVLEPPVDARRNDQLSLRVKVPWAAQGTLGKANQTEVRVKAYSGADLVAEATAPVDMGAGWTPVAVDLSRWKGKGSVDRVKVWARGGTSDVWTGSFLVDDITFAASVRPHGQPTNIAVASSAAQVPEKGVPVSFTVTNRDTRPVRGVLTGQPCLGTSLLENRIPLPRLAPGATTTVVGHINQWNPKAGADPVLCVGFRDRIIRTVLDAPAPTASTVFGFDDGTTQGWQAGEGVASVAAVSSFANGPGAPQAGVGALDATATPGLASAPKTVFLQPTTPLNLSDAAEAVVWVDSYGGAPGATGYEAVFTLYSGADKVSVTSTGYAPDRWNELTLPIASWAGRSSVTRAEVSFRAVGSTYPTWDPHFQIDTVSTWAKPRS